MCVCVTSLTLISLKVEVDGVREMKAEVRSCVKVENE